MTTTLCCWSLAVVSVCPTLTNAATPPTVIPVPRYLECRPGEFKLHPASRILVDAPSRAAGEYLAQRLCKSTGYPLSVDVAAEVDPAILNLPFWICDLRARPRIKAIP